MTRIHLRKDLVYWGRIQTHDSYTCILIIEIKEWLEENTETPFKFDFNYLAYPDEFNCYIDPRNILNMGLIDPYIDFESVSDAVLFKLYW
jgi:hypothetical protein